MSHYPSFEEQRNKLAEEQRQTLLEIPHVNEIDGWLLLEEAVELFSLVEKIAGPAPTVCEIGSWKGKSAYVLASALRKRNGGTLFCVDPFTGEGDLASAPTYQKEVSKLDVSLLENFRNTMNHYELFDYIKIIPSKSEDARKKFNSSRIDLLFIDGNHEDDDVFNDFDLWAPLVVSGGYVVVHDVGAVHVTGPRNVYEQRIARGSEWSDVRIVGEMAVARRV